ncbi:GNAT family N-acetyltransferase [Parasulfitobacter algicola]|uniref:GNAT family N-acetyltransferase n=1 Tax=Parasulfitobacter algicola TaxID=2614809 RepID=A0ABX2IXZ2_9RHOB|nr:GNAT family N-acetyltransferase [Sulfitobacter algicola]
MSDIKTLRTPRFILRPVIADDAPWIAHEIANPDVQRMLTRPPHPYTLKDAQEFVEQSAQRTDVFVIQGKNPMGIVSCRNELGYWLAKPCWRKGVVPEAASAVVDHHFQSGGADLNSGHFTDNPASAAVLSKLGFQNTHVENAFCNFRGVQVPMQRMILTHQDWLARRTLPHLTTPRLTLRPMTADDAPALAALAGVLDVARMIFRAKVPWPEDEVRDFIHDWRWQDDLGFRLGIYLKDTLIGSVGISKVPDIFYFFDQSHWGRGYASEALHVFLTACYARFAIDDIEADVFHDNPASMLVLERLGFEKTGNGMGTSAARLEPAPVSLYRLTQERFGANP